LHKRGPLIDGHNDLPWQLRTKVDRILSKLNINHPQRELHTDIPRLRKGGLGGQFWSVYVDTNLKSKEYVGATLEQIDVVYNLIHLYPDTFQIALTADQIEEAFNAGKIASLIGVEGGHCIGGSLATLRMFHRLGARYMTLTHSKSISWADSCTDMPLAHGLTEFGREVVREMNRLGMIVDLSHVSVETMNASIDTSMAPVIFSHSSARALTNNPRNVPDNILRQLSANGGMIMVAFVPSFVAQDVYKWELQRKEFKSLENITKHSVADRMKRWDAANPMPIATVTDVVDHIDHIRSVVGIEHIGIGSDFDGVTNVPHGLEDVSQYPMLTAELLHRNYGDEDILKILGGNILRVMHQVETVAQQLQRTQGPSEALLP
jgi:membrane dipeptidase